MGCGTSSPGRCSTIETQYKLMRLAQSQGLFCEASRALAAVKASPGSSAEDLLPSILADLKPLAPAPMPLDPRHVTPDTLRAAAAELAANQSPSDDGSNPEPHLPGPLELQYLEETAPAMKPEDIPAGLRTHIERCETCAICAAAAADGRGEQAVGPPPAARVQPRIPLRLHRPMDHRRRGHVPHVPRRAAAARVGARRPEGGSLPFLTHGPTSMRGLVRLPQGAPERAAQTL